MKSITIPLLSITLLFLLSGCKQSPSAVAEDFNVNLLVPESTPLDVSNLFLTPSCRMTIIDKSILFCSNSNYVRYCYDPASGLTVIQHQTDGVPENILFVKQYDLNDSSDPGKAIFELHDKSRPLFYTWRFYGDYVVVRVGTTTTTWYVYDINRDTSSPLFEIPYKYMPDSFEIKDG